MVGPTVSIRLAPVSRGLSDGVRTDRPMHASARPGDVYSASRGRVRESTVVAVEALNVRAQAAGRGQMQGSN